MNRHILLSGNPYVRLLFFFLLGIVAPISGLYLTVFGFGLKFQDPVVQVEGRVIAIEPQSKRWVKNGEPHVMHYKAVTFAYEVDGVEHEHVEEVQYASQLTNLVVDRPTPIYIRKGIPGLKPPLDAKPGKAIALGILLLAAGIFAWFAAVFMIRNPDRMRREMEQWIRRK